MVRESRPPENVRKGGRRLVVGQYTLSWINTKEEVTDGLAQAKIWVPEEPRVAKSNGYYPTEESL